MSIRKSLTRTLYAALIYSILANQVVAIVGGGDGPLVVGDYDIENAVLDSGATLIVGSQIAVPEGGCISPDGFHFYVVGGSGGYQYTMTTAWDLSTATYASKSFAFSAQDSGARDIYMNDDGTKIYMAGNTTDFIFEYDLGTAYDISTCVYNSISLDIGSEAGSVSGLTFSVDGTMLYTATDSADVIFQYALSTGWDLSTASYTSKSYTTTEVASLRGIAFSSDGLRLFALDETNGEKDVNEYALSTAWDVSTASFSSIEFLTVDTNPNAIRFSADGSKMYIVDYSGASNAAVYQYDTVSPEEGALAGNLVTMDTYSNLIIVAVGITNTIDTSFATPGSAGTGLTYDYNSGNLISMDSTTDLIYVHDGVTSSIGSSFAAGSGTGRGLGFDGTNLIHSDSSTDRIYIHDGITSSISGSFASASINPRGVTYDTVAGNLIVVDSSADLVYIYDGITSSISSSFAAAGPTHGGLGFDGANLIGVDLNATTYIYDGVTSSVSSSFASLAVVCEGATII